MACRPLPSALRLAVALCAGALAAGSPATAAAGQKRAVITSAASCSGTTATECAAWQELFDATDGQKWAHCTGNRLKPCDCGGPNPPATGVTCNDGHITAL